LEYKKPSGVWIMAYSSIDDPAQYFNIKLYTGNATNPTTISGIGFQPDWVWTKGRSTAEGHRLCDSVRGATKDLLSNNNAAESTNTIGLKSFNSDGYVIGNSNGYNLNSATFVSWNWLAGGSASSNSDGSITSSVSANTTAGFSIVSYTATGSNATVGHGLGSAPQLVIIKDRDVIRDWITGDTATGFEKHMLLNTTNAASAVSNRFQDTAPSSSVITIGTHGYVNNSGSDYIAYCFAEKKGYSKIGSYTGNGSTDGTFIYTGFHVRWVLIKRTNGTNGWYIYDTTRDPSNQNTKALIPNETDTEQDESGMDLLSNGFKLRNTDGSKNGSSNSYIYMAFAESPLVNSNGIPVNAR
jgi:hypothetical protein